MKSVSYTHLHERSSLRILHPCSHDLHQTYHCRGLPAVSYTHLGAWGIALLAAYLVDKKDGETLDEFLDNRVFAGNEGSTLEPEPEGVKGFNEFMDRYLKGLPIERAAVESKIW